MPEDTEVPSSFTQVGHIGRTIWLKYERCETGILICGGI